VITRKGHSVLSWDRAVPLITREPRGGEINSRTAAKGWRMQGKWYYAALQHGRIRVPGFT